MPMSAVTIGRPIATTEPNATSSTMMATPTPISSLLGVFCASWASVAGEVDLHAAGAGVVAPPPCASSSCVVVSLSTA